MAYIPVFKASRHGDILSNFVPENNMKHNIMNEKAIIRLVRNATLKINYAEHEFVFHDFKSPLNYVLLVFIFSLFLS